jgi:phage repressor protein C with HTH and peptisase S24 domain
MLGKRLKQLREGSGLSKVDLAKKIGVSDNQIRRWEAGEARPRPETEDLLIDLFKIDPIELYAPPGAAAMLGDVGSPQEAARAVGQRIKEFRNDAPIKSLCVLAKISEKEWEAIENGEALPDYDQAVRISEALGYTPIDVLGPEAYNFIKADLEDYVLVPQYDVEVSAGDGAQNDHELPLSHFAFLKSWLVGKKGLHKGGLFVVTVRGDSMEPDLSEGDVVLVDRSRQEISEDGLFVVRMSSWLYVKRLQRLPGGQVRVLSNNPKYAPMEVDPETPEQEFQVIGKVVWVGREV